MTAGESNALAALFLEVRTCLLIRSSAFSITGSAD